MGWVAIVDKSVHTSDDIDIGDIDAVNIILDDQKKAARRLPGWGTTYQGFSPNLCKV